MKRPKLETYIFGVFSLKDRNNINPRTMMYGSFKPLAYGVYADGKLIQGGGR